VVGNPIILSGALFEDILGFNNGIATIPIGQTSVFSNNIINFN
jgi:hypothetical protein